MSGLAAAPAVVAAVDGSAEAADAVLVADDLARGWQGELHIAHVWSGITARYVRAAEGAGRRLLADAALNARRSGAHINGEHFLVGDVTGELTSLADDLQARLLVAGQHQHSRAAGVLLGSVAHDLIRSGKHPLLLVGWAGDWPPSRVVVGDDGSAEAGHAALLAAAVAARHRIPVELLHSWRHAGDPVRIQALRAELTRIAGAEVTAVDVAEQPASALEGAIAPGVLLAVGSGQRGLFDRLRHGSVALSLLPRAPLLLVVPKRAVANVDRNEVDAIGAVLRTPEAAIAEGGAAVRRLPQ